MSSSRNVTLPTIFFYLEPKYSKHHLMWSLWALQYKILKHLPLNGFVVTSFPGLARTLFMNLWLHLTAYIHCNENGSHLMWSLIMLSTDLCYHIILEYVDMEWRIGSAHAFDGRGPGFDPTPKPRIAFFGSSHLPNFRQRT